MKSTSIHWEEVYASLNERGYALIRNILSPHTCQSFIDQYQAPLYRSVIAMERYRFGKGEYKYFNYPLPETISSLRTELYPPLSLLANDWMAKLSIDEKFPSTNHELLAKCKQHHQIRPTPLILRYEKGGYNTLHQDLYGAVYFPFQVVFALTQQGQDHEGGEFILLQQIPRAQSKAEVVAMDKGDAIIFTTNFRPVKGTRGYYRATMKHGVSEIRSGTRYALGIIFHDAA
jgi:uncharacterized protein